MTTPQESPKPNKEEEGLPDPFDLSKCIEFFDKYPERIIPEHLNNFWLKIPSASKPNLPRSKEYERMTMREILQESGPRYLRHYSEKRAGQTYGEFDREVGDVLASLGLDFSNETLHSQDPRLVPIYLELRKRGYGHYDLIV
jgi:hypothetical protein